MRYFFISFNATIKDFQPYWILMYQTYDVERSKYWKDISDSLKFVSNSFPNRNEIKSLFEELNGIELFNFSITNVFEFKTEEDYIRF